jgi:hypothetical protein
LAFTQCDGAIVLSVHMASDWARGASATALGLGFEALRIQRTCLSFFEADDQTLSRPSLAAIRASWPEPQSTSSDRHPRKRHESARRTLARRFPCNARSIVIAGHPDILVTSLHILHFGRYRTGKHGFLHCLFKSKNYSALPLHRPVAL